MAEVRFYTSGVEITAGLGEKLSEVIRQIIQEMEQFSANYGWQVDLEGNIGIPQVAGIKAKVTIKPKGGS